MVIALNFANASNSRCARAGHFSHQAEFLWSALEPLAITTLADGPMRMRLGRSWRAVGQSWGFARRAGWDVRAIWSFRRFTHVEIQFNYGRGPRNWTRMHPSSIRQAILRPSLGKSMAHDSRIAPQTKFVTSNGFSSLEARRPAGRDTPALRPSRSGAARLSPEARRLLRHTPQHTRYSAPRHGSPPPSPRRPPHKQSPATPAERCGRRVPHPSPRR